MRARKIIGACILTLAILAGIYFFREYNRTNDNLRSLDADITIAAPELLKAYQENDSVANKKFLGKVLMVEGKIKSVDESAGNISLDDAATNAVVRCAMDSTIQGDLRLIKRGNTISIKGVCTGFNKDDTGLLGDEVILNRCVLVK